jgi:hypothetical protein
VRNDEIIMPGRELVFPGKGEIFVDFLYTDHDGVAWVCYRRLREDALDADPEHWRKRIPDFISAVRHEWGVDQ